MLDPIQIMTRDEFKAVVLYVRKHNRFKNSRQNGVIFRLAACCGLRVREIAGLKLADVLVHPDNPRPHIQIPATLGKGGKARKVPLWWDAKTLQVISRWKDRRIATNNGDWFVASINGATAGKPLSIRNVQARYAQLMKKALGQERGRVVMGIHKGRHFYCSACVYSGIDIIRVKNAMGHANLKTTSLYASLMSDDSAMGNAFKFD